MSFPPPDRFNILIVQHCNLLTWVPCPSSRSSCQACSCAFPTTGRPPCCPPAWTHPAQERSIQFFKVEELIFQHTGCPILQRVDLPIYLLAVAPLDELGAALRILRWNMREIIKRFSNNQLLVITDKLLKLTDFRRKLHWVLPQILRRDLTVNCPSIRSTTNDQEAAWPGRKLNDVAATEEMSRSANLGAAITIHRLAKGKSSRAAQLQK